MHELRLKKDFIFVLQILKGERVADRPWFWAPPDTVKRYLTSWLALEKTSFFYDFYFSIIVDVQCSVNFYCTAKWPSHTYIYICMYVCIYIYMCVCVCIYILFLTLCSIMFHHKWPNIVPCAIQKYFIAYPLQRQ